jgi:ATP-dependent DNA helicase RecQ
LIYPIKEILKQYWDHDSFRSLQEEIILAVLDNKDTLAVLPTGGGKSACFQIPSLAKEGICLVISPLIALMKDQVQNLKKKGIPALTIYSGMSYAEAKRTLENATYGNYKFLYVSPERLESVLFLEYLPGLNINLIAVDEAHCVSQWGYDFRPSYLKIVAIREYFPDIPLLALTASATKVVQDDIIEKLEFKKDYKQFNKSFSRPNLSYSVFNVQARQTKLLEILKNVKGSSIVYCRSRKRTKEIAELLNLNGIKSDYYHAGLTGLIRNEKQENWVNNEVRVIVCTNAFGMGIDKPDVRVVVHYEVPDALEYYYQEAGRAGRDDQKAYCVLLYNDPELNKLQEQVALRYPSTQEVKKVYKALVNYLQIPSDSGEGLYYDFDLADFAVKFDLNAYTLGYSLKTLEQEGIITFSEQLYIPSSVVFSIDKEGLEQFQESSPQFEDIIKGLLRSYGGIFDFPCAINELHFARFIKIDVEILKADLIYLDKVGIIKYQPQKDKPQVQFLVNRLRTDDLRLNEIDIQKRRKAYEERLNGIINYTTGSACRSVMIGSYFNDSNVEECGICDNCINRKNESITKNEFELISESIIKTLNSGPINTNSLLSKLNAYKKENIWEVINHLLEESKIKIDKEGLLTGKP